MQVPLCSRTLLSNKIKYPRLLGLWLFEIPSALHSINNEEKSWVEKLPSQKAWQYHFSRGCTRNALSEISGVDPLAIPLIAPPSKPPKLANGWGHISISHCKDALMIAWSTQKIGIDIERSNRRFAAEKIANRYFCESEKEKLRHIRNEQKSSYVLERWVVKEASIKWQEGKIADNLSQWEWNKTSSLAFNHSLKCGVSIYQSIYNNWIFAIACNAYTHPEQPIICITKNINK